jgi:hypothetical protein
MNPWQSIPVKMRGKFKVGDKVRLKYGHRGAVGEIVEDSGFVTSGGRRYYTVRLHTEGEPESPYAEEDLELVER